MLQLSSQKSTKVGLFRANTISKPRHLLHIHYCLLITLATTFILTVKHIPNIKPTSRKELAPSFNQRQEHGTIYRDLELHVGTEIRCRVYHISCSRHPPTRV